MSEPQREWRFYITDMQVFAARVVEYTHGLSQAEFESKCTMRPFATLN